MTKIVLTYRMTHDWSVEDLLTAYKRILQRAIDEIWKNTTWKEKKVKHRHSIGKSGYKYYETTRLIPYFPNPMSSRGNSETNSSETGLLQNTTLIQP